VQSKNRWGALKRALKAKFVAVMWKKFKKRIAKLHPLVRNFYFMGAVGFLAWMLFMDDNNLFNQYRRHRELSALLEKERFYKQQIDVTEKAYKELSTNPETQEKFAREHYWMKRDDEDVFVIVKNPSLP